MFFHENMYIVPFLLFQGAGYSFIFKTLYNLCYSVNGCVLFHQVHHNHPIFKNLCHHLDNSRCFCFYLSSCMQQLTPQLSSSKENIILLNQIISLDKFLGVELLGPENINIF